MSCHPDVVVPIVIPNQRDIHVDGRDRIEQDGSGFVARRTLIC